MEKNGHRKRKRHTTEQNGTTATSPHKTTSSTSADLDTSKPTALFQPTGGRTWTVSIAVPGSIIANAQAHDLKTALASSIARCAAVFCIDEIVVFDDTSPDSRENFKTEHAERDASSGYSAFSDPCHFLTHLLSYLETPPHLRRALFGFHPDLRTAGACPSLDMPHHLREGEWCRWREGVTLNTPVDESEAQNGDAKHKRVRKDAASDTISGTLVNAGLTLPVNISVPIPPNTRVTLDFNTDAPPSLLTKPLSISSTSRPQESLTASPVSPSDPRTTAGYYWGYTVRRASLLSAVFTESVSPDGDSEGYDYCIGTSERGVPLSSFLDDYDKQYPRTTRPKRILIAFGGPSGLEAAVANDPVFKEKGLGPADAAKAFDAWVNLVPAQGSRTVRTGEAVWIGCATLRSLFTSQ